MKTLFEDHAIRTSMRREALCDLLQDAPNDDKKIAVYLNGILSNHHCQESRWQTWEALLHLTMWIEDLHAGADIGFDDLGDDVYVTCDREQLIAQAEADLDEALNQAVGPQRLPRTRVPVMRRAA